jgi:hypothetical protein
VLQFKPTTNITNVSFDAICTFSKDIIHFTEIKEVNPIPSKTIIYKTVTGIGATHSEIVAERSSIIVLPHISIVKSKHEYYKESHHTFAVYGDISCQEVANYLASDDEYAKILTTPKGLNKVIKAIRAINTLGYSYDYKKLFFLLIDECHKVIQDAFYRTDMVEVMEHFFEFERKAMVSATPIPPSDPRFDEQEFKHIKVTPDCDYKQDIELIHADSLINGLQKYFKENDAMHYCIFFNSVEGIKSLIQQLKLIDNYQIFCSQESNNLLKLDGEVNSHWQLKKFKRFNFFTSSFYNGLDITEAKPNIVILTDYGFRGHTILDPYTDILQIIGRFRKKEDRTYGYNKITHINNTSTFTNPIPEEEALTKIGLSEYSYTQIKTLKDSLSSSEHHKLFDQALSTQNPYFGLLTKKGEFSHFLKDNYLDDERVKNYYKNTSALRKAYEQTKLYNVTNRREMYEESELVKLQNSSIRYSPSMNRLMANTLLELEDYQGLDVYYKQRNVIAKLSYLIFQGYDRLGYSVLESFKFKKTQIKKALLDLDIKECKNSFPVIDLIYSTFLLGVTYSSKDIKLKLQNIFDQFILNYKAKGTEIEQYFEFRSKKDDEDNRAYVFTAQKFFPVQVEKHV